MGLVFLLTPTSSLQSFSFFNLFWSRWNCIFLVYRRWSLLKIFYWIKDVYVEVRIFHSDNSDLESGSAICTYFLSGTCSKGVSCPFRHVRGERLVVCKHWLRGLCKKGDNCEFLHEYDMTKMPECYFYSRFGRSAKHIWLDAAITWPLF